LNPERISPPSYWRTRKERYSLLGKKLYLSNPGEVVIFRGNPFHLGDGGRTLIVFTDEERRNFVLNR